MVVGRDQEHPNMFCPIFLENQTIRTMNIKLLQMLQLCKLEIVHYWQRFALNCTASCSNVKKSIRKGDLQVCESSLTSW